MVGLYPKDAVQKVGATGGRVFQTLVPCQVEEREGRKLGPVDQRTTPDCTGLVQQTPEPLQAYLACPARRRRNSSAVKLDGCPNRHDHGNLQPAEVGENPPLLFRKAE